MGKCPRYFLKGFNLLLYFIGRSMKSALVT